MQDRTFSSNLNPNASPLNLPCPNSKSKPTSQFPKVNNLTADSHSGEPVQVANDSNAIQNLVALLATARRDPLPKWKLDKYDGDPLLWHEWYGQFKSTIHSAAFTDDMMLTYLNTLVTGKAKAAISGIGYCGSMYGEALRTLERKLGQPHIVVTAYLEKLNRYPPEIHNSESLINYSQIIASLVGVFRSLGYESDLSSVSLLNQSVSRLPPNLGVEFTVKSRFVQPTVDTFNQWLQDLSEAHERMQVPQNLNSKCKTENASTTELSQRPLKVIVSMANDKGRSKSQTDRSSSCPLCKLVTACSASLAKFSGILPVVEVLASSP